MKITSAEFDRSAPSLKDCPNWNRPEFALIGRSNVGKSSLINALTRRKDLAKVSDTPGKTKLINYFIVNGTWCLVDLPGYGYAKTTKGHRADFNQAVAEYLKKRENLLCTFVLLDANLPPQDIDLDFVRWLADAEVPFVLVFTKADRLSASAAQKNISAFEQRLAAWWGTELPGSILSSSKSGTGQTDILEVIDDCLTGKT